MSPMKRFWSMMSLHKPKMTQIYIYAIVSGLVNLSLPLGIQSIIGYIQSAEMSYAWGVLVGFVLLGITIAGVLQILQLRIVENIQQDIFLRSAFEFAYRIPKIKLSTLDDVHMPELVNRFFDTLNIQKGIPKILIDLTMAVFQIVFGLLLLTFYSTYFVALIFVLIAFVYFILKIYGAKGLSTSLEESKNKYKVAYWLEEIARTNKTFKRSTNNKFHLNKTDHLVDKYLLSRESHFRVIIQQKKMFVVLRIFLAAGLLIAGSLLVLNNQLNIGQFVAAEIVIILIIASIEKVVGIIETIYDVITGLEKIGYVADLSLDNVDGNIANLSSTRGLHVELSSVVYAFANQQNPIVQDFSLQVNEGEIALIKGRPGSGATSLLKLIAGMYDLQRGEVLINQIPIENYKREFINEKIGIYFSTNEIFEGTILENIIKGFDVSEHAVHQLVTQLNLDSFINKQKEGLHAPLDALGRRIPKSVIQKLLLARAVVNQPQLLLLDDPLTAIDEEEQQFIFDWLTASDKQWTIIVNSRQQYWKTAAQQIIQL